MRDGSFVSHLSPRLDCGAIGDVVDDLESVITAAAASADQISDGRIADAWHLQMELGALEHSLTRALALVQALSALAMGDHTRRLSVVDFQPPPARPPAEPGSMPVGAPPLRS